MKKYTDLTQSEKLALDDDSFAKAVKIEAIDRGIKLPLTLDEYNRKVDEQRRREYLALANGDESIAQAFWAKTERREWPRELTA